MDYYDVARSSFTGFDAAIYGAVLIGLMIASFAFLKDFIEDCFPKVYTALYGIFVIGLWIVIIFYITESFF